MKWFLVIYSLAGTPVGTMQEVDSRRQCIALADAVYSNQNREPIQSMWWACVSVED